MVEYTLKNFKSKVVPYGLPSKLVCLLPTLIEILLYFSL